MVETFHFTVPGLHCSHCESAVRAEVGSVPGVDAVMVDLETKRVQVVGGGIEEEAVRAAIREAGYEVA